MSAMFAVSVLIQVTAISGLALAAIKLAGIRRPALRHTIGLTALVIILLWPFITPAVRQAGIAVIPATFQKITIQESLLQKSFRNPPRPSATPPLEGSIRSCGTKRYDPLLGGAREAGGGSVVAGKRLLQLLPLIWLAGIAALFIRLIYGMGYQQACCRRARPLDMGAHNNAFQNVRKILKNPLPPIFVSHLVDLPLAAGWFRPRVLLPEGLAERITEQQLECILLHECAHIVRGDQWIGVAQRVTEMIFWFHPFVHMLNRQIGQAREEVCDNYALQKGGEENYARTLLQLAEFMPSCSHVPATAALIGPKWKLEERVKGILDERRQVMTHINKWATGFIAAVFIGIAILSSVKAENGEKTASVPTEAVKLEVHVAELSQADAEELGLQSLLADNSNGQSISSSNILNNTELTPILKALQKKKGVNCLSAPTVITKNGCQAAVKVIEELKYPVKFKKQEQPIPSVHTLPCGFKTNDVGVILEITPTVEPDKEIISLILEPKVIEVTFVPGNSAVTNRPVFHSTETTIPVSIKDGQTVVISGLVTEENDEKTDVAYPVKSAKMAKNLLIFVTASRVDSSGDKKNDTTDNARVMNPDEYKEIQDIIKGETSGIGVVIKFDSETGLSSITEVIPDSPADKAGIKTGDRIVSVNDKTYKGRQTKDVVAEIRGKAGEKVSLKILRGDSIITKEVVREKIVLNPVHAETLANKVGLVSIRYFDGMTSKLLGESLEKLKSGGITALVVDLRGNPGGLFDQVVKSAECLLPKGAIVVRVESHDGKEDIVTTTTEPIIQGIPVAVLVDDKTSCGGELLAASLADNLGAKLVGSKTRGKWTVDIVKDLPDKSAVQFPIQSFKSPKNKSYQDVGLEPDVKVAAAEQQKNPAADETLQAACKLLCSI